MSDWRDRLTPEERSALHASDHPDWLAPMLATLTDKRFSDAQWLYARKLDGARLPAFRNGERVRLLSRTHQDTENTHSETGAGDTAGG